MPEGVRLIFTAVGPEKCPKNWLWNTLQKWGSVANESAQSWKIFLTMASGHTQPTSGTHNCTQFLHKKLDQIEIPWNFTYFHSSFSPFLLSYCTLWGSESLTGPPNSTCKSIRSIGVHIRGPGGRGSHLFRLKKIRNCHKCQISEISFRVHYNCHHRVWNKDYHRSCQLYGVSH